MPDTFTYYPEGFSGEGTPPPLTVTDGFSVQQGDSCTIYIQGRSQDSSSSPAKNSTLRIDDELVSSGGSHIVLYLGYDGTYHKVNYVVAGAITAGLEVGEHTWIVSVTWDGTLQYSAYYSFTVTQGVPSKPITPTPANETTEVDFSGLTLSWEDGGGATSYDVYIGPSGSLVEVSTGQAGTSYVTNMDEVPLDQIIYWRVDAVNDAGTTTGDDWHFDARPGKVSVLTPADEASGLTLDATVASWEASSNAESYDTYFGLLSGFLSLIENTSDLETVLNSGNFFTYGDTYYWRVDAVNAFGTTQGDELYFTTIFFDPPLPTGVTLDSEGVPTGTPTGANNIITVKRLVAIAQNKVWYEDI